MNANDVYANHLRLAMDKLAKPAQVSEVIKSAIEIISSVEGVLSNPNLELVDTEYYNKPGPLHNYSDDELIEELKKRLSYRYSAPTANQGEEAMT
jgi:hypothetical protein